MSALQVLNVKKSFGGNRILDGVSLVAEPGEFIALVGPSGCGKSTLLRVLAGLEPAEEGEILVAGQDVTGLRPADRNIALVFQSYALYPHLTTAQNIAVPLLMRGLTRAQRLPFMGPLLPGQKQAVAAIQQEVRKMAATLQIDHLLDRKPGQMSGGQRQRVALARAMVRRPAAFLMDEPLSNLDANLRVHARGEIVDLHRKAGVPTLYVTHDQTEALSMADRVAVMMAGSILQIDTPRVIYDDPQHVEVAKFIGQPRINLLSGYTYGNGLLSLGQMRFALTGPGVPAQTPVTMAIRPEFTRLVRSGAEGLPGQVERVEFLGSEVIVHCRLNHSGEIMVAKVAPADSAGLSAGIPVCLSPAPEHVLVFGQDGSRLAAKPVAAHAKRETVHG